MQEERSRSRPNRRVSVVAVLVALMACGPRQLAAPTTSGRGGEARWVVIGDFGSGSETQHQVADAICEQLDREPFSRVVTTGDNVYARGEREDFQEDFFVPYRCLKRAGIRFHAVLGNHDVLTRGGAPELSEVRFGMPGRYYDWRLGPVYFVMLDSNDLDAAQMEWMRGQLPKAQRWPWTVVVFHHPVYSSGVVHPSTPGLAHLLEPLFDRYGVDLVLNGHDHNFQRALSKGITYVVSGGGGARTYRCREPTVPPVKTCVSENHFLEVEATPDTLSVSAIDAAGTTFETFEVPSHD